MQFIEIFRNGVFIISFGREREISLSELTIIPLFLRFDNVKFCYFSGAQPIEEKYEWIEKHLLPFKSALKDTNWVEFTAGIADGNDSEHYRMYFVDHVQLLEYIHTRFLQLCTSTRGYKFDIHFFSNRNPSTNITASLLQMDEIKRCTNITIKIYNIVSTAIDRMQLPIEEISNWLEYSSTGDGMENIVQIQKERFLEIGFCLFTIQNVYEMLEHLKMVHFLKHFLNMQYVNINIIVTSSKPKWYLQSRESAVKNWNKKRNKETTSLRDPSVRDHITSKFSH